MSVMSKCEASLVSAMKHLATKLLSDSKRAVVETLNFD